MNVSLIIKGEREREGAFVFLNAVGDIFIFCLQEGVKNNDPERLIHDFFPHLSNGPLTLMSF